MPDVTARSAMAVIECAGGAVPAAAAELVGCALAAAGGDNSRVTLVAAGGDVAACARELSARYGTASIALGGDALALPDPALLARCLAPLAAKYRPELVCLPHSTQSALTAAMLAVEAGAECLTAVEAIGNTDGALVFTRSLFNGRIRMEAPAGPGLTVITALPGVFPAAGPAGPGTSPPETVAVSAGAAGHGAVPLGITAAEEAETPLTDAAVIVAAGRGIGNAENLSLIRDLAAIFPGSALGASRPVCDQKWLPYAHQVGATGKTVRPRLYIACGISGSQQHIAGMKASQCVVAINRDPAAAIFSVADYIVAEDLVTFIPLLVDMHRNGAF